MTETRVCSPEFRASLQETLARAHELRAASAAIRQRMAATQEELAEVIERSRQTLDAARDRLARLPPARVQTVSPKPASSVSQALAVLGRDDSDLDELTGDLIAAYKAAAATGDDDMQLLLANALMQIGRHIASQIGPKASGVVLN